jgi:hypothetical protein
LHRNLCGKLYLVEARNLLNDDTYNEIKNILLESEQWAGDLKKLEEDIALRLV